MEVELRASPTGPVDDALGLEHRQDMTTAAEDTGPNSTVPSLLPATSTDAVRMSEVPPSTANAGANAVGMEGVLCEAVPDDHPVLAARWAPHAPIFQGRNLLLHTDGYPSRERPCSRAR